MLMNGKAEIVPQTASGFLDMISDLNALAAKGKIHFDHFKSNNHSFDFSCQILHSTTFDRTSGPDGPEAPT